MAKRGLTLFQVFVLTFALLAPMGTFAADPAPPTRRRQPLSRPRSRRPIRLLSPPRTDPRTDARADSRSDADPTPAPADPTPRPRSRPIRHRS